MASFSWKFIEAPFRSKSNFDRKAIFRLAGASAAVLSLCSLAVVATGGLTARFRPEVVKVAAYMDYDAASQFRDGVCFISSHYVFSDFKRNVCMHADPSRPNVLIAGDSQAADLWYGLNQVYPDLNIMQLTASGCQPTYRFLIATDKRCIDAYHFLYDTYLPNHPPISLLILGGRWTEEALPLLPETLDRVRRIRVPVLLIGPRVQYDSALPRLLALGMQNHDMAGVDSHQLSGLRDIDRKMARIAKEHEAAYVSLIDVMCDTGACVKFGPSNVPVQSDYGHFTSVGSVLIAERLRARNVLGNLDGGGLVATKAAGPAEPVHSAQPS